MVCGKSIEALREDSSTFARMPYAGVGASCLTISDDAAFPANGGFLVGSLVYYTILQKKIQAPFDIFSNILPFSVRNATDCFSFFILRSKLTKALETKRTQEGTCRQKFLPASTTVIRFKKTVFIQTVRGSDAPTGRLSPRPLPVGCAALPRSSRHVGGPAKHAGRFRIQALPASSSRSRRAIR